MNIQTGAEKLKIVSISFENMNAIWKYHVSATVVDHATHAPKLS